ncbi:MAG: glutathione S-transferase N-terminal domain-containing protein [Pseudomonadota bacterium]
MKIDQRALWFMVLLVLGPLVAALKLGIGWAVIALALWLLVAWSMTLSSWGRNAKAPALVLETIPPSHFAEKVRWCMDRLELDYEERVCGATLGAFFGARTIPVLHVRTGAVISSVGNSPEILRYLWGRYGEELGERAEFLRPIEPRRRLEAELDRYGVQLQRWVYFHMLKSPGANLHVWGVRDPRVPLWQRALLVVAYPLLKTLIRRAFGISDKSYAKAVERIEAFLQSMEERLVQDGGLVGRTVDYTDLTFAALSSIWVQPENFARGQAKAARMEDERMPAGLLADRQRWQEQYPAVYSYIRRLYALR